MHSHTRTSVCGYRLRECLCKRGCMCVHIRACPCVRACVCACVRVCVHVRLLVCALVRYVLKHTEQQYAQRQNAITHLSTTLSKPLSLSRPPALSLSLCHHRGCKGKHLTCVSHRVSRSRNQPAVLLRSLTPPHHPPSLPPPKPPLHGCHTMSIDWPLYPPNR